MHNQNEPQHYLCPTKLNIAIDDEQVRADQLAEVNSLSFLTFKISFLCPSSFSSRRPVGEWGGLFPSTVSKKIHILSFFHFILSFLGLGKKKKHQQQQQRQVWWCWQARLPSVADLCGWGGEGVTTLPFPALGHVVTRRPG